MHPCNQRHVRHDFDAFFFVRSGWIGRLKQLRLRATPVLLALGLITQPCIAEEVAAPGELARALVQKKAATVELIHRQTRTALVNLSHARVHNQFLAALQPTAKYNPLAPVRANIDNLLLRAQHDLAIERLCLNSADGVELSCVEGERTAKRLSNDIQLEPWFEPGLSIPPTHVEITSEYRSIKSRRWVVAYSTPVRNVRDNVAVLHFERALADYERIIDLGVDNRKIYLLAVTGKGWVIADTRRRIKTRIRAHKDGHADYFRQFSHHGYDAPSLMRALENGEPIVDESGDSINAAFARVGDWTLFAFER